MEKDSKSLVNSRKNIINVIFTHIGKYFKKRFIYIKRNMHVVPLSLLVISCVIYTFALSAHSRTIQYIPYQLDAFFAFLTTLCSILSIFTFIFYVPKRNVVLYLLVLLMSGVQIYFDLRFTSSINRFFVEYPTKPVFPYIYQSHGNIKIHIIFLVITIISILLLPLYNLYAKKKKLIRYETRK